MKVIDFEWEKFTEFLNRAVAPNLSGRILVLGVAKGGLPIARHVYNQLLQYPGVDLQLGEIQCQRPTTKMKKGNPAREQMVRFFFSITPKFMLNKLRVIEHNWLSSRAERLLCRNVVSDIPNSDFDIILVVDDAVDSGASLFNILENLTSKQRIPTHRIKTLTVALTQQNPILEPDYVFIRNVLVRFPWSLDAKQDFFRL